MSVPLYAYRDVKQKHFGCKKCEANQKQQLNGYTRDQNVWYLAKAKNYTEYKIGNLLYWNAVC